MCHRSQAEDALSHQESGAPRGTMTKLPIMLLQVDKSSLTGVHMQESVLEDRFGIVQYTTFAPAVAVSFDQRLPLEVFSQFCS